MTSIESNYLDRLIDAALHEDMPGGDVTTDSLVPQHLQAAANFVPRSPGVIAGLDVARAVFARVDPEVEYRAYLADGDFVEGGETAGADAGTPMKVNSLAPPAV